MKIRKEDLKISEKLENIVIILDGAADNQLEKLNNETPLKVANTPNLDKIVKEGCSGSTRIMPKNTSPGTETALLSLLGYPARKNRAFEAIGRGKKLDQDDLVIRSNFANHKTGRKKLKNPKRTQKELQNILNKEIEPEITIDIYEDFKSLITIKNRTIPINNLELPNFTDKKDVVKKKIEKNPEKPRKILKKIFKNSKKILNNLNEDPDYLIPWSCNYKPDLKEKYQEIALKTNSVLVKGIGKETGMKTLKEAKEENHQFRTLLYHFESIDEISHDLDLERKIDEIERIDREIYKIINQEYNIVVLTDHITSVETGEHKAGAIPLARWDKIEPYPQDPTTGFNELDVVDGAFTGKDLVLNDVLRV